MEDNINANAIDNVMGNVMGNGIDNGIDNVMDNVIEQPKRGRPIGTTRPSKVTPEERRRYQREYQRAYYAKRMGRPVKVYNAK